MGHNSSADEHQISARSLFLWNGRERCVVAVASCFTLLLLLRFALRWQLWRCGRASEEQVVQWNLRNRFTPEVEVRVLVSRRIASSYGREEVIGNIDEAAVAAIERIGELDIALTGKRRREEAQITEINNPKSITTTIKSHLQKTISIERKQRWNL